MKRLNALSLLLGFAVFIPISGCSQFAGVSKNCDELAQKYLKTRFENAAANNESPPSQIAVVKAVQTIEQINSNFSSDSSSYKYKDDIPSLKTYSINQRGEVAVSPLFKIYVAGMDVRPTTPEVVSSNQIVCRYEFIKGDPNFTQDSKSKQLNSTLMPRDYPVYGNFVQVSEDKDSIYWKENQFN
jgi:hypothetical protein